MLFSFNIIKPCVRMLGRLVRPVLQRCATARHISTTLLPEDIELLRTTCWDFAEQELKPIAGEIDKEHKYPLEQVMRVEL